MFFYIDKGDVFGWGNSEYSQFGNITNEKQLTVGRKLNMGQTGRIMKTAAGGTVCAVLNGKTYTWNDYYYNLITTLLLLLFIQRKVKFMFGVMEFWAKDLK